MHASLQNTRVMPVLSLLFAATMWGIFWYPLRWLEGLGLQGVWMTLLIYCGTLIYALPIIYLHRKEIGQSPGLLVGVALSSGWCNTSFILALLDGEVVRVILLFYLSPVWATLLARIFLNEILSTQAYFVLLVALSGAMIMLWSPEAGYPWPGSTADWMALTSGFAFALTNMFVNMARKTSIQLKTATSWAGVILVASIALLFREEDLAGVATETMLYALILGMTFMALMTWAVVYGVTHLPVHRSAIILLFEIVASVVSTYLLIDERLEPIEWFGGIAVMVAAYFAARLPYTSEKHAC